MTESCPAIASNLVAECAKTTVSVWPHILGILVRKALIQLLGALQNMFGKLLKAVGR
jgi:hypothetical protein